MNTILAKMTAISASIATWLFVGVAQASGLGVQGGANAARGADQPIDLFGVGGTFSTITNVLLFIVGAIAVIMIVIGGLRYVTSGGNQNAVTAAKNTILYAIIGIIVAILAYAVINFVLGSLLPGNGGGTSV
ncbi:MAG TPA: hypothetical protein PKD19_00010 [Candidatus Saccharibacteria bacterium]|jgi:uncharacterized membrane protein|nr:hypothetical protein [Candidatus Saccharibacteria bacterium]HMR38611.1 hypothetical protein [Candidatus Saccharibacteria bacterium]